MKMTQPLTEPNTTKHYIPENASPSRVQQVLQYMAQMATLSQVLRLLGAIVMVGGMSLFLLQGWQAGNDFSRFVTLLTHTLLLTGAGFFLSHVLKEFKGARLFFGLSLISVTANFAIMGALIFSVTGTPDASDYPNYASWIVQDPTQITWLLLGAALVLIPVTFLSYAILARPCTKWLATSYLLGNALLLIPTRSSLLISALILLTVCGLVYLLQRNDSNQQALQTFEGRFAKATLFIPAGLILTRSFLFYNIEAAATAVLSLTGYIVLQYTAKHLKSRSFFRALTELASPPLMLTCAGGLTVALDKWIPDAAMIPFFSALLLGLSFDFLNRMSGTTRRSVYGFILTTLLCLTIGVNELLFTGFLPSLLSMALAMSVAAMAYWYRQRWNLVIAGALAVYLTLINSFEIIQWEQLYNWVTLSVIGATTILLASLIDRHGATIKLRLEKVRARVFD